MRQAYLEGKDLYCVIASNIYNNNYEDNLEFYPEGTKLEFDGKITVAGSDKTFEKEVTDTLEVPYYFLVPTLKGELAASNITTEDVIVAKEGNFKIAAVETVNDITTIYFKN